MCIPWPLPHVMIREPVQWSPILTVISRYDTYDVGVGAHNDPGVMRWDASPFAICNDAGNKVGPAIEVEP